MEIHITGANGFLAKYVMKTCEDVGSIHGTDIDTMDITKLENVFSCLQRNTPDVIIHLASLQGRSASRERPIDFFNVNTWGTLNLLETCRRLDIKKFIYMSSLTVHGKSETPVNEQSPINPIHPYGASKAAAEAIVQAYSNSFGIQTVIFRPNFISGKAPTNYKENLIYNFIDNIENKGCIELAGDGHYQREWTHPQDIAEAIRLALLAIIDKCEIFILSEPGNRLSMYELANRIINKIGKGRVDLNPSLEGFSLISTNKKAIEKLNWRPKINIDSIIEEIWDGYKSKPK